MKQKLFSIIALLLMAATGAMAQEESLLTTLTFGGSDTYSETTSGVVSVTATNVGSHNGTFGWLLEEGGSLSVTAEKGYTITKCVFRQNAKTPITDTEAPFEIHAGGWGTIEEDQTYSMNGVTSIEVYGYVTPTYTVTLADGTEEASKWQAKAGEGAYQSLPLEGVAAGTAVTITYSGEKRVKSVTAVEKAATIPVTWTPSDMSELYVNFNGSVVSNNEIKGITVTAADHGNGVWIGTNFQSDSSTLTFTSSVGNIKSIVISAEYASGSASPTGWTFNSGAPATLSWSGTPSTTVEMPIVSNLSVDAISEIVFTIEPKN